MDNHIKRLRVKIDFALWVVGAATLFLTLDRPPSTAASQALLGAFKV